MTRDPIGERGGLNLYGFVGNNSNNRVDSYGLAGESTSVLSPNSMYLILLTNPWFRHYFLNNGGVASIVDMGYKDAFLNAPGVASATKEYSNICSLKAKKYASMYCSCGSGNVTLNFQVPLERYTDIDFTNVKGLLPLGNSNLSLDARCNVDVNCSQRRYSYECDLHYYTNDAFVDPIDVFDMIPNPDIEIYGGTPYTIIFDHRTKISGGGKF